MTPRAMRTSPPTEIRRWTRRGALGLGGALAAGATLSAAGCGGFSTSGDEDDAGDDSSLRMVVWAGPAEEKAFKALAEGFRKAEGITVKIDVVPFTQALTTVDTRIRAKQAPDVFRVTYNDVGTYRAQNVLAPLTNAATLEKSFGPAFWRAVTDDKGTFGVPHHTDTSMVLVNKQAAEAAKLPPLPTTRDTAWTWDEFLAAARKLKASRATKYAFGVNWQQAGAYRWLNWLHQAGGRLLDEDLKRPAIASAAGEKALRTTQSFFTEGLVPPTSSTKGQYVDEQFTTKTIGMAFIGDFLLADLRKLAKFDFTGTFLPRDARPAADLGGNALVATDGPKKEQAVKFLEYCVGAQQMADFCAATTVLPTRTDVDAADLKYTVEPQLMELYVEQAKEIPAELTAQVTVPAFTRVNTALVTRLEQAFVGKAAVSQVLDGIASDVSTALR